MAKTSLIVVGVLIACLVVALVGLRVVGLDPKERRALSSPAIACGT